MEDRSPRETGNEEIRQMGKYVTSLPACTDFLPVIGSVRSKNTTVIMLQSSTSRVQGRTPTRIPSQGRPQNFAQPQLRLYYRRLRRLAG